MDKYETQSGGHVKEGHEEGDISVRGILWSGVFLAVGGFFALVLMIGMIWGLEWWERKNEAQLTPMEKQLLQEREPAKEGIGKEVPVEGQERPGPDWYGRTKMEEHLRRTFKDTSPRLQYDDEHDMTSFTRAEDDWLKDTGKSSDGSIHIPVAQAMDILAQRGLPQVSGPFQPSNVGAPSAAYPSGASESAQAARTTTPGGNKQ